ncbi:ABC transporter permease [Caldicellulosiruptor acetigenus]|uniref:ABC transporter permease n=1 Tax=Caldicellulosiruptor acetigenus TaxID=301953 RepID=UPI0004177E88|nr:ABC transporter permease subunit [Caldicellulosiruptor acetigenus]WAM36357.1 ABC transporter permease subunit [Caldicellulosiruptor acetigenus]
MSSKSKSNAWKTFKQNKTLVIMSLPAIVFFFIFSYIPMPGIYIAFTDYRYDLGIFKSPFVGFENFRFLIESGDLLRLVRNTVLYNIAFILVGNIFQIFLALLLNEINNRTYRKITQSFMLLPHFISYVLVGLFVYNVMNYDYGLLNILLKKVGLNPIPTYSNPDIWPYVLVAVNLWKNAGYGSIIYFATLTSIDPEIIESAMIDGASHVQKIRYILLPLLRPTFVILLLFSLGGILRGDFGLFYNVVGATNALLYEKTDIIETFVFRSLVNDFNFSMASAVSFFQSVFGFFLVVFTNWLVKKIEPDYALF